MKKQLTVSDRLTLSMILPVQDTFENMILREDVMEKVKITQAEIKKLKLESSEDGNIKWDDKAEQKAGAKTVNFTQAEFKYIRSFFIGLKKDKKSKFGPAIVSLYKKFK